MTPDTDFLTTAFETVRQFLKDAISLTGPSRRVLAVLRARLKAAHVLIRRLVCLMALAGGLPDVSPPVQKAETKAGRTRKEESAPGAAEPGPVRISLAPGIVWLQTKSLPSLMPERTSPDVETGLDRAMDRLVALYRIAADPAPHAARMAALLARQRAAGAMAPICEPMARADRLPPAMGLIAGALQHQISRAAAVWYETG